MAINGKVWSAIVVRNWDLVGPDGEETQILYYGTGMTTPEAIAALYPTVDYPHIWWDTAIAVDRAAMRYRWLGQNYPIFWGGYPPVTGDFPGDQAAMLDSQWYGTFDRSSNENGSKYFRWTDGVWRDGDIYSGEPGDVWVTFPDNPLLGEGTNSPFGFGYGLVRYQLLTRGDDLHIVLPDPPEPLPTDGDVDYSVQYTDYTYIFTPTYDGTDPDEPVIPPEDGEGDGLNDESVRLRVWGFSLDGHDYYVLRMGPSASLIYDLTTNTWSEWRSPGRQNWRAHIGQNWLGMSVNSFSDGTVVTEIVAGDDASNVLWTIDPTSGRDDRFDTGDDYFRRVTTGGIRISGRDTVPAGALTLDLAVGAPTQTGASLTLEISDDLGHNWINCGTVETAALNYDTVVEWRGLGTIKAPGRIFRISDTGASVRINAANMR